MAEKIGRYEILREIGCGRSAVVYLARDPNFQREVAVKVALFKAADDPALFERFLREARAVAALEHPAIVPIYDFGEADGRPFLVMRYLSGGSLAERIRRGSFPIAETARVLQRIGAALDAAHAKGIVHRELKPSNILFDPSGEAFLTDFGIALISETVQSPTGEDILGTPLYMSPEQIRGEGKVDGRTDIYALGIVLFEMLTGKAPFQADTPSGLMMMHLANPTPRLPKNRTDLPESVNTILIRATAKEPEFRFQSASEIGNVLAVVTAPRTGTGAKYSQTDILLQETSIARVDLESDRKESYDTLLEKQASRSALPVAAKSRRGWVKAGGVILGLAAVAGVIAGAAGLLHPGGLFAPPTPSPSPTANPTATVTLAPTIVILLHKTAPTDGAFMTTSPKISWNSGNDAINYEYCVDTTDNDACDRSWVSTESSSTAELSGLTNNATYYWQVRTQLGNAFVYADGGTWWSFIARNQTFADVPIDHPAWPFIEAIYNAKLTGGCTTDPLAFCPEKIVTRAEMAILLLRLKYGSDYVPPAATGWVFTDIPKTHWAAAWIEKLYADKITTGCGYQPMIFCPNQEVTRAAFAVFLLRTKYGVKYAPPKADHFFRDVPVKGQEWMEPWIDQFYREVAASACGTNPLTFCPGQSMPRAEVAELIVRAFHLPMP
jgi:serine/threonine protein kinase